MNSFETSSCLVGYSGFVGGNLSVCRKFTERFRSSDIQNIEGKKYNLIICAGVPAMKYLANRDPAGDMAGIKRLLSSLRKVETDYFILISTIDVFPNPRGVNEETQPSYENHPYGCHRLLVEEFVNHSFPNHLIVRLPGLFGPNLKKNVIFDLIHNNNLDKINPESCYQYYNVRRLAEEIDRATVARLRLLHIATEPIRTKEIVSRFFPGKVVGVNAATSVFYDFQSRYAEIWGKDGPYLFEKKEVMADLASYLQEEGI